MRVRDIMNTTVDTIDPTTTIRDAAKRMRSDNVGALPVASGDQLMGIITDRDIVTRAVAADEGGGNTAVSEVMSSDVYCAFDDDEVENAARIMSEHQVRRLPVLNRRDRLVGIVSLADIARVDPNIANIALMHVTEPTNRPRR